MFFEFITQNWFAILILIGVLAYIIYLSITRQWTKVREFAYQMMLCAERTFGDQDGKLKFEFVASVVYAYLPSGLKMFVKEENIRKFVQEWYQYAKDFMDDGIVNDSIKSIK